MKIKYHELLPHWAQDMLREAAAVEDTPDAPRAKDCAIEAVMHELRLRLPSAFVAHQEETPCHTSKGTTPARKSGSRTIG